MNGELAQIIALVAHGGLFLSDPAAVAPDLLQNNSTFHFISSVTFARYGNKDDTNGVKVANGIVDWFDFLRLQSAIRIRYAAFAWQRHDIPEYIADSFSNGVSRCIQVETPRGFEYWYPKWTFSGSQASSWHVEYRSLVGSSDLVIKIPVEEVRPVLSKALMDAEAFAHNAGASALPWADLFAAALTLLDDPAPTLVFHPDMLPEYGYDLEARQVLAAAVRASVFGGAGSWNDLQFGDQWTQQEYHRISQTLYNALKAAILSSANSFSPDYS